MRPYFTPIVWIVTYLSLLVQVAGAEPLQKNEAVQSIQRSLEAIVVKQRIPGIIAAIASSNGIEAIASAGVRKAGSEVRISENDLMHLGSCTKAMTSILIADLVDKKVITWATRIIDVFPELNEIIHRDYHEVTVWDLLTHRSGISANPKSWWIHLEMPLKERRFTILKESLHDKPNTNRGKYVYSNLGYMVAGCMVERLTNSTWETLIQKHLFDPLKMTSAGFGAPGTPDKVDQPWGHFRDKGEWKAKQFDNSEALGPAGRVHCTVEDWVRFISLQLPHRDDAQPFLDQALLDKVVTPIGEYAGGWFIARREWANGTALNHSGSNTTWYCTVWVAPMLDRAYIVVTNSSDENSNGICDNMISQLIAIDKRRTSQSNKTEMVTPRKPSD